MLLKNFCMAMAVPIVGSADEERYRVIQQTSGSYTRLNGFSYPMSSITGDLYDETGSGNTSTLVYEGIILGTGTTPPTYSDYKMENYSTGLTYSNSTTNWSAPNFILTESATNNTDANIIVSEVGVFGMRDDNATYRKILLTRNVIEPVTIKPNETKTFTVKINFDKFSDAYSAS